MNGRLLLRRACRAVLAERHHSAIDTMEKVALCLSVSVFTSVVSLVVLGTLAGALGVAAWLANVVATAVGTVPSYLLNRRWVWQRQGSGDPWREVAPFWLLSFTGLVASTIGVALADRVARAAGLSGGVRTLTLLVANVGSFGLLWVGQFLLLDRVLFRDRTAAPAPA